jgi:tetratricopeptide (TPR) repeat protein
MMHLAVSEDDMQKAESLVARVGKDYADSAMFAVAARDSATVTRLLAEARDSASLGLLVNAVWQITDWLQQPAAAEPFARAAVTRPERTVRTNLALADNLVAQGRWTAADSAYRAAARGATDGWPRLARGMAAALPFLAVPRPELEAIRADLAGWDPARSPGGAAGRAAELMPQVRLYALGLLASRLGDPDAALRAVAQLETSEVTADHMPAVRALAAALRADVALAARRPADAVHALEDVRGAVPLDLSGLSPFTEDYARFLRSEALLALGRDEEALPWLQNGFDGTQDESRFRAQVSLRLGDIFERKGERQKAIDEYARFVRFWAACDARLRPAVDDARSRLARLTGEPRT